MLVCNQSPSFGGSFKTDGGDAESRTPVQRRSHISVYSLDDIDLTFVVDIDELAKGEIHYFSSTT